MKLINGGVYRRGLRTFILVFLGLTGDKENRKTQWGMLHLSRHVVDGMSAPMFQSDKDGQHAFTEEELKADWNLDDWTMLDGRLRIQKIDLGSFIDYVDGGQLVPFYPKTEDDESVLISSIREEKVDVLKGDWTAAIEHVAESKAFMRVIYFCDKCTDRRFVRVKIFDKEDACGHCGKQLSADDTTIKDTQK